MGEAAHDPGWKKGHAELPILSLLEARPRHEISELIEQKSQDKPSFPAASLDPLRYRLEKRGWLREAENA